MKFIYKLVSKLRAYLAAKVIFEQVFDEKDDEERVVRISQSYENSGGKKDFNLVNSEKPQKSPMLLQVLTTAFVVLLLTILN